MKACYQKLLIDKPYMPFPRSSAAADRRVKLRPAGARSFVGTPRGAF